MAPGTGLIRAKITVIPISRQEAVYFGIGRRSLGLLDEGVPLFSDLPGLHYLLGSGSENLGEGFLAQRHEGPQRTGRRRDH